jgi:oxygen-independent coproporphyrinogen-3 oxidase
MATQRHRKPENWIGAVARNGHGLVEETPLPARERAVEALLMGLRLRDGVDLSRIARRTGIALDQLIDRAAADRLSRQGLVVLDGPKLRVTDAGMLLLDAILAEVVAA